MEDTEVFTMREYMTDNHVGKKHAAPKGRKVLAISPTVHLPYNQETQEAIEDVLHGRNLRGPFYSVDELFQDLERNLDADD